MPRSEPRIFPVRYGPQNASFDAEWPNNLQLAGSGTVEVTADAVKFTDSRNAMPESRRTFALADVANVGFGESGTEIVIVVRTRSDEREVHVWIASREEARALLELLPRGTTPEFVAHETQWRRFRANLAALAPKALVTPTIIGLNVAYFLVLVMLGAGLMQTDGRVELAYGSNYGPLTWNGQPWRLLTAAFIHFGLIHIAFNMYALYNGGILTEKLFGSARFAVIYLLAALSGSVVSSWWNPLGNSAGASGAIFGVFGALLVFIWRCSADVPRDLLKSVRSGGLSLLIYSVAMGVMLPFVDNAAHIGGFLGGSIAGLLLVRPFEPAARTKPEPGRIAGVIVGICAALVVLAWPLLVHGVRPSGIR